MARSGGEGRWRDLSDDGTAEAEVPVAGPGRRSAQRSRRAVFDSPASRLADTRLPLTTRAPLPPEPTVVRRSSMTEALRASPAQHAKSTYRMT
ncbi:hypothetical protein ACFQX6_15195 [Streptosporangium lutulentum]